MNAVDRFLTYVSFDTQSDENSTTTPSTEKQKALGAYIAGELEQLGLKDVHMDEKGYVYAKLPANTPARPSVGLIAHMDTSPAASGAGINARVVSYQGGDIPLNEKIFMKPEEYPCLNRYQGQDLIVTDGTTLLGADDKAGAAEIVSALEYLISHPDIPHGNISAGFTPDEEIGRGADAFDISGFGSDYAYTVDGGALGEIEYECFNAASVKAVIHGVSAHTGSAKGTMKNAVRIAAEFAAMLPADEIPEKTEGYEGFFHIDSLGGDVTEAFVNMLIRDHSMERFLERKALIESLVQAVNDRYGAGTMEAEIRDTYYNMKEKILPVIGIVEKAQKAMRDCGVEPIVSAIRGGTDGARLSYEGLPCPNLSTGGENFHSIYEFIPVQSLEKMVEVLVRIVSDAD